MPASLRFEAVSKRYPGSARPALREIDLTVGAGETLALLGESGSGKTTLLKTVNRLVEPTVGTVLWGSRPVREEDPIALRRRIGYVQQDGGLIPHWTTVRNVELVPGLLGWSRRRRRERARELLARVGLEPDEHGDRHPARLSGGQRQRVAVARALAAEPELLLLDEPFGALDAVTRARLHGLFEDLRDELGFTAVLVTHDLAEAFRLGHRVAVMLQGQIVRTGTPAEIATEPRHAYVRELLDLQGGASAGRETGPR